jgi:predicted amidohydrolase
VSAVFFSRGYTGLKNNQSIQIMKICAAQTRPLKGDIPGNTRKHLELLQIAIGQGVDMVVFPELSLTGYEPGLVKELATSKDDPGFDCFQDFSNNSRIIIGVGMPISYDDGIAIGLILFQPGLPRQQYLKNHLHADEEPFFVSGRNGQGLLLEKYKVGLAICYELSIPSHPANAFKNGAAIYIASVAKTAEGTEKAINSLSAISQTYSMASLFCNSVGPSDNFVGGGKSSAWNNKGLLMGQLDESGEGILVFDTFNQSTTIIQSAPGL